MSISTEITRLNNDRNRIRNKLVALGLSGTTDNLDQLTEDIEDIVNRGAPQAEVAGGETYAIQPGYYQGGTITGTGGGGGEYTLQQKSATPTTSQQVIAPDSGYYGLSQVVIGAIPSNYADVSSVSATPDAVLTGTAFVGADGVLYAGTMLNRGKYEATIDGLNTMSATIPVGYHNGSGTITLTSDIENRLALI